LQARRGLSGALLDEVERKRLRLLVVVVLEHLEAVDDRADRTDQIVADTRAQQCRKVEGFEGRGGGHEAASDGTDRVRSPRFGKPWRGACDTPRLHRLPRRLQIWHVRRGAGAEPTRRHRYASIRSHVREACVVGLW